MTTRTPAILLAAALLVAASCKKDDDKDKDESGDPPTASKTETDEAPPASEDEVPAYSPEAAEKALTALAECTSKGFCDAYDQLVSYGDEATEGLLALAADDSKGLARRVAVDALLEIEDAEAAMPLFELAKEEQDTLLRGTLYEAAATLGGDEVFEALTAWYADPAAEDHENSIRNGLAVYGERAFTWAAEQMASAKDKIKLANVILDSATAANADALGELIDGCKDPMVCHRLASKAIELGDTARFEVLLAGLASKNEYDRADAGNMFARVADQTPEEIRAKAIELLTSAKERDKGGLTSRGYDTSLEALGAE